MSLGPVRVPRRKLEAARAYQQKVLREQGFKMPLWQCLIMVESGANNAAKKNERGFFGGFV
jgi:hypothetical protein